MTDETETKTKLQHSTGTPIGELRLEYGPRFAPGYGDRDTPWVNCSAAQVSAVWTSTFRSAITP